LNYYKNVFVTVIIIVIITVKWINWVDYHKILIGIVTIDQLNHFARLSINSI
jgi:hypothetical protein